MSHRTTPDERGSGCHVVQASVTAFLQGDSQRDCEAAQTAAGVDVRQVHPVIVKSTTRTERMFRECDSENCSALGGPSVGEPMQMFPVESNIPQPLLRNRRVVIGWVQR